MNNQYVSVQYSGDKCVNSQCKVKRAIRFTKLLLGALIIGSSSVVLAQQTANQPDVEISVPANSQAIAPVTVDHQMTCEMDAISWLNGHWQHHDNRKIVTETWQQVSENTMEGVGKSISKQRSTVTSESLRIVRMADGIFYLAKVGEHELPIAFKLTSCQSDLAIFENAHHDFPQKISYQLLNRNQLIVKVTDLNDKGFSLQFSASKLTSDD